MRRFTFVFVLFIIVLFAPPTTVFASTITFENGMPAELHDNGEYSVKISVSVKAKDGEKYYLRGLFHKENVNNYCGYTWNGSDWFSGPYSANEGWKHFQEITIANNVWVGELKAKFDSGQTGCKESGSYLFKVQRFTPSGSVSTDDQQEQQIAVILDPSPTPTVKPTATPKPVSTLTPIPKPTVTKTPTKSATSVPTATITLLSASSMKRSFVSIPNDESLDDVPSDILGLSTQSAVASQAAKTPTPTNKKAKVQSSLKQTKSSNASSFFVVGALFFIGCGILVFIKIRKRFRL